VRGRPGLASCRQRLVFGARVTRREMRSRSVAGRRGIGWLVLRRLLRRVGDEELQAHANRGRDSQDDDQK